MTTQLMVTVIGVLAALWVGWNTHQTRRDMVKASRARRLEETLQLAQKINEAATSVNERGRRLKLVWEGLYRECGAAEGYREGLGGTQLDRIANEIRDKQETVTALRKTTSQLLENGLEILNNDQIEGHRVELQGHLIHIEEIRRTFESDLAHVQAERLAHIQAERSGIKISNALRSLEHQISRGLFNGKSTL